MTRMDSAPLLHLWARFAWLAASGTWAMGCVPSFDDDLSEVERPRILAVQATPPEVRPGEPVELSALIASSADHAEPELRWSFCLARKPLTELGPAAQECLERSEDDEDILANLGSGLDVAARVPEDACRLFGPEAPFAEDGALSGRPVDPDITGGYHQPVTVENEIETVLGSIRLSCGVRNVPDPEMIRFNAGYRPNENPALERLEAIRGEQVETIEPGLETPGLRVARGEAIELRATWPACPREPVCGDGMCTAGENQVSCAEDCRDAPRGCAGAETYLWANPAARRVDERREGLSVSWYATAGRFDEERTGRSEKDRDESHTANHWVAPSEAGDVRLWIVLRDDRGGVGWASYLVEVEP